jgi:hypothetical protein
MTVAELIEHLRTLPKDLPVVVPCFSEQLLLETGNIEIKELCEPRPDGWIQNKRPDKPSMKYLVIGP